MVDLSWPMKNVMQEHLQSLVSQGYTTAVELATNHALADPASPAPVGRYVVASTTFYERWFAVPSH
jgi:hypothetical protein